MEKIKSIPIAKEEKKIVSEVAFDPDHGCGNDPVRSEERLKERLKDLEKKPKKPLDPRIGNLK